MTSWVRRKLDELEGVKKARLLSTVAIIAVLVATLWPLSPFPKNRVTWLPGTNGLKFERPGLVVGTRPMTPQQSGSSQSRTIELMLRPAGIKSLGTILAFYSSSHPRQSLQVRQWRDGLLVTHDARVESDRTRTIKFDVDHVFHRGKLVFLTVSSGPHGTSVYVDGQLAQSVPTFNISSSDLYGEVILGISPEGNEPWKGEVKGFAIYASETTPEVASQHYHGWTHVDNDGSADLDDAMARYTFSDPAGTVIKNEVASGPDLTIPAIFSVPHKAFLESPMREFRPSRSYAYDLATNIAGFVPLGMVVFSYLAWTRTRWKAMLVATLFCGALSFSIEVMQYCVPSRGSGITDIITNTLGAGLGAMLVQSRVVRDRLSRARIVPSVG